MAKIKVDHSQFEKIASSIESYIAKYKTSILSLDNTMIYLNSSWHNEDYNAALKKWSEIIGKGSTSENMLKTLQNYADALRKISNMYKETQSNAANRANSLCK